MLALAVSLLCVAAPAAAATLWVTPGSGPAQAQALTPSAPSNPSATCTNPTLGKTITVTWTSAPHATSYNVYQSTTSASSGYTLAASGITGTSWASASLTANKTYWYEIAARVGTNWQGANSTATTGRKINSLTPFCQ